MSKQHLRKDGLGIGRDGIAGDDALPCKPFGIAHQLFGDINQLAIGCGHDALGKSLLDLRCLSVDLADNRHAIAEQIEDPHDLENLRVEKCMFNTVLDLAIQMSRSRP